MTVHEALKGPELRLIACSVWSRLRLLAGVTLCLAVAAMLGKAAA